METKTNEEIYNTTTIQITKDTREKLKEIKVHPKETYNSIIRRLLKHWED